MSRALLPMKLTPAPDPPPTKWLPEGSPFLGLDGYNAPQNVAANLLTQLDNCMIVGGEIVTRLGKQAQLAAVQNAGAGDYALTIFRTASSATPPVYVNWLVWANSGQIYIQQVGLTTAPTALLIASFTYTDLVIGSTTTHVSSVTRPFVASDVGKTLTIRSGTGFNTGAFTIGSVAVGVATLSGSAGTAASTGGIAGMTSVAFNLNTPSVRIDQAGKWLYVVDGQSGLYRIFLPGASTTTAYTVLQYQPTLVPATPTSIALTNVVVDAGTDATKWSSFPAQTTIGYQSATNGGMVANPTFTGGTTHDTDPPPTGWQTGGDSMDFFTTDPAHTNAAKFDSGISPQWVDEELLTPAYQSTTATYTDIVLGTGGLTASSAARPFLATDAGGILHFVGKTGVTAGNVTITSVSNGVASLALSAGTATTTAVHAALTQQNNTIANARVFLAQAQCAIAQGQSTGAFQFMAFPESPTVTATRQVEISDLVIQADATKVASAAQYTFVAGDVGKILTVISGTNFTAQQVTITAVAGGVASTNGTLGTAAATGGSGILGLDASATSWGHQNFSLQNPPSAIPGASTKVNNPVTWHQYQTVSQLFSLTGQASDFPYLRYRVWGPAANGVIAVDNCQLTPIDVRLNLNAATNGLLHLSANNAQSGQNFGFNCLGGCWVRRDFTATPKVITDLAISSTNTIVSSALTPFVAGDAGRYLYITGAAATFTVGVYKILSVDGSGNATLSAAAGTASSSGGFGTVTSVQDLSGSTFLACGYSAPATSGQIAFRMGFQAAGEAITAIHWTAPCTYTPDGTAFYGNISTVPSSVLTKVAYLYIQIVGDLAATVSATDLCTLGPVTQSGNLSQSVGSGSVASAGAGYNFVVTEVNDTRYDVNGNATGDTVDGQVESDPSPATVTVYPNGIENEVQLVLAAALNSDTNFFYVYEYGGIFPGTDSVPTYRLVARLPKFSNTITADSPGVAFCTWDHTTRTFVNNTPDQALFLAPVLAQGRNAIAGLAPQCFVEWQNRPVVATGSQLNVGWLIGPGQAQQLYFNSLNIPDDPYGEIKGIQVTVGGADNDPIMALVSMGPTLVILKSRSVWLLTGTDGTNFDLSQHLFRAGIGCVAPNAWALMQNPSTLVQNVLWFLGPDGFWEYDGGDMAHPVSQILERLLNPNLAGGDPIGGPAYANASLFYHGRRMYALMPTPPFSYVDLVVEGTNTQVWSPSRPFIYCDVGKTLTITSSTAGWTAGTYTVLSVANGIATLSSSPGAAYSINGQGSITGDTANTVAYVYDTRFGGWSRWMEMRVSGMASLTQQSDTDDLYAAGLDGMIYQITGSGDKALSSSSPLPVSYAVRSRGMGQEQASEAYWLQSRPVWAFVNLSTRESVAGTLGVECPNAPQYRLSYTWNGGNIATRTRVPTDVRGQYTILSLWGASVTQTTISAFALETAEGRPFSQ